MLQIVNNIVINDNEIEMSAVRSQGAGGQNVNKVSSAIHLRFDIRQSSLPEHVKNRLLRTADKRITREGIIVIKAQQYRTQESNRQDALARLKALLLTATRTPVRRIPTKAGKSAHLRRLDSKNKRGNVKNLRRKITSISE